MTGIHPLDIAIVVLYLVVVVWLGFRAGKIAPGPDGFFLANRKLGKLYQFFLNFGNATDANGAVGTSSIVYQYGASGAWMGFQLIFLNPYYWFMYHWFRRARLTTTADLFEDRLGSRKLASFYALFQSLAAVFVVVGFGDFVTYKVSSALLVKPETAWTAAERASVDGFKELRSLEHAAKARTLSAVDSARLDTLRERDERGELKSYITALEPLPLYIVYSVIVGLYVILGGLAGTAINEIFQSLLILAFSIMLLPLALTAVGGLAGLRERVPVVAFQLVGTSDASQQITVLSVFALVLVTLVQIVGIIGNMGIAGSAKNEFAARFGGVSGSYAKRLVYIMWTFVGLLALALFSGDNSISDPDLVWGTMSRQLLGPGLLGLMLVGVLAANMSTVAAQSVSISALVVRNLWRPLRPEMSDRETLCVGRITVGLALVLGIFAASMMDNVFTALTLVQTISVPFGATVLLMFFWRRLTVAGAWLGLICAISLNIVGPFAVASLPTLHRHPVLVTRETHSHGRPEPVYFEKVVRTNPADSTSPLIGKGRLHLELVLLSWVGMPIEKLSSASRFAARYIFDAVSPFVFLIGFSLLTRPPDRRRVDLFYGRMKTPVGDTAAREQTALEETVQRPDRFDQAKLLGRGSSWEFTKWDRTDTVGFLICCAVSGGIIGLFWLLLRLAAGAF
jgi:Na+/proline symporter